VTRRRFYSSGPQKFDNLKRSTIPETDLEALMEAPPNAVVPISQRELQPLLDVVRDLLDELDERERWVLEGMFWRGHSYRTMAVELAMSKTHIHRIARQAMAKMAERIDVDYSHLLGMLGAQPPGGDE
jgi:RNA polymerase sigma factor (sigma-70 family)